MQIEKRDLGKEEQAIGGACYHCGIKAQQIRVEKQIQQGKEELKI